MLTIDFDRLGLRPGDRVIDMTISNDGVACLTNTFAPASPLTAPQPFDQPFSVLLTQVLGTATNAFSPTTTTLPATTDVDWVRVWS